MVAMLLFLGGGAYSAYEGIHKLRHPSELDAPILALCILGFGLAIESWSMAGAVKAVNERRNGRPMFQYLRESKDSDLVVIFGEDAAACLGLAFAFIAVAVSWVTGDPMWDALGTLAISVVLVGVAVFLAIEVKSMLLGEAADTALTGKIEKCVLESPEIVGVIQTITMQQGPGEILVAMKLHFKGDLTIDQTVKVINATEKRLRAVMPELKWVFIEPDHPKAESMSRAAATADQ
jgi:divalent metal cation (Fe/Co/Zn/Cd) transporter